MVSVLGVQVPGVALVVAAILALCLFREWMSADTSFFLCSHPCILCTCVLCARNVTADGRSETTPTPLAVRNRQPLVKYVD